MKKIKLSFLLLLSSIILPFLFSNAILASIPNKKVTKRTSLPHAQIKKQLHSAKIIKHKIKRGDTLFSILKKLNFSPEQIKKISRNSIIPKYIKLKAGEEYFIIKSKRSSFQAINILDPYNLNSYLIWKNKTSRGNQKTGQTNIKYLYERKTLTSSGKINGSIIASIIKKTGHRNLAYQFLDAYSFDFKPSKSIQKNAKFSLTYEKLFLGKTLIRTGRVLNTQLEVNGKLIKKKLLPLKNSNIFVTKSPLSSKEKRSAKKRSLFAPVSSISVSSPFNRKRLHPITKRRQPHNGVDLSLAPGSPVYSAQKGIIKAKGYSRAGGHYIRIQHKNGLETSYNHLEKINRNIKKGKRVLAGEIIASVGCSGYCTKPHLHFQVKKSGRPVDPIKYTKSYPYQYRNKIRL